MARKTISGGTVHELPPDIKNMLLTSPEILSVWEDLTPLARNEWICWTTSVKKAETRLGHIERMRSSLLAGKRRPCCWPGCSHREKNGRS